MHGNKCLAVVILAVALFGCQTGGVPESAVKEVAPDGYAMGGTSAVAILSFFTNTTSVYRDTINNCDVHVYRPDGINVRAESICGGDRSSSEGRWHVNDDGTYCGEFDNPDWKSGCSTWAHQGDGDYSWEKTSGEIEQTAGKFSLYEGNPFDL